MVLQADNVGQLLLGLLSGILILNTYFRVSPENGKESDNSLVQRAKNGDTGAFDRLVMRYQKQLHYTVIRIVLNHDDADDIVQDSFIKAFKNLEGFDDKFRFYTWLSRIAVNTAINLVQHKKHREDSLEKKQEDTGFDPPGSDNSEESFEFKELRVQVHKALDRLSPDMRSIFVLRVYEELSYNEIAETLEISIGTVMSRLNRARNVLKHKLESAGVVHK